MCCSMKVINQIHQISGLLLWGGEKNLSVGEIEIWAQKALRWWPDPRYMGY